jgi:ribosomal protein S18 acetylase RimI-like enzyme
MSPTQYQSFIEISTTDQVHNQVLAGRLDQNDARQIIDAQLGRILPRGMDTPGHEFYAIESAATGEHVGDFWFTTMQRAGRPVGFVMDIQIHPVHRRRGYGAAAFAAIEKTASAKGLSVMALDVAGHNLPARALYQKLGYREVAVSMTKVLGTPAGDGERDLASTDQG